jgi:adenylate cyclase, class 2
MNDAEIEIQVSVEHLQPLKDFLAKHARSKGRQHQIDEYFTPAHRDFLAVRPAVEWLRLRNADGVYYKYWHHGPDGKSHHCDEYESQVESLDQLKKIFQALNLQSLVTIDKRRATWNYQDWEIALDQVKGLGDFVEIEYKGAAVIDQAMATTEMIKFLKAAGCGRIEINYSGYPFMMLYSEEVKYEVIP